MNCQSLSLQTTHSFLSLFFLHFKICYCMRFQSQPQEKDVNLDLLLGNLLQVAQLNMVHLAVLRHPPLSQLLDSSLKRDPLYPILTTANLNAVDRRHSILIKEVEECIKSRGREKALVVFFVGFLSLFSWNFFLKQEATVLRILNICSTAKCKLLSHLGSFIAASLSSPVDISISSIQSNPPLLIFTLLHIGWTTAIARALVRQLRGANIILLSARKNNQPLGNLQESRHALDSATEAQLVML